MDSLLPGSDYNQLRAFVAVGELLSFSRAAEVLGVSPSALSQMVRGFEERVGVRLLKSLKTTLHDMSRQAATPAATLSAV
jgi:DNA-binding transcriptional regulator YdaS (Cro superfamily)